MTTHTTVNAQRAADKLRQFVGECSPRGYATIPVSVVYMAIRALEQQQVKIDAMTPICIYHAIRTQGQDTAEIVEVSE